MMQCNTRHCIMFAYPRKGLNSEVVLIQDDLEAEYC